MIQKKLKIEGNISLKKWKQILRIKMCCKPKNMSIVIIYFKTFFFCSLKEMASCHCQYTEDTPTTVQQNLQRPSKFILIFLLSISKIILAKIS